MKDLAGKVAFVTGAASGIGLGISTALAQAGAKVVLCDIEDAARDRAVEDLKRKTNADVMGVHADVSLKTELQKAADETLAQHGKVHILVNNAGVAGGGGYGGWTDKNWRWTLDVNLMAVVWGVEIFGPLIERQSAAEGGHIVSTASMAGMLPGASAYNVSKFGVVSLMEGLRPLLAPRGIGVSVLCPGFIHTNIMNSNRNRPERFAEVDRPLPTTGVVADMIKMVQGRIETGIDPLYVGELVREGIENDWPHIFTDNEFEPNLDARFAEIKKGFDRIRGRVPRRG
ncbi:MAG: SDR family NAD(P)-dependent oxidoreductase [Alphaproteobacteria bacterium]|nr:SDR family NAD(P)-dependent oxidoreductase [Alphaproteobacteria bacterium]MBL7097844.1 SDR family NAD(P)-dependent oxidoreductase [Alphaproteobacteria bacterium]